MKKIKILSISTNSNDGVSWYRSIGPFRWLERDADVEVKYVIHPNQPTWQNVACADVVYMLRPVTGQMDQALTWAKALGIPTIIDWDDDVLNITSDNPNYDFYRNPQVVKNLTSMIQRADMVWASTNRLGEELRKLSKGRVEVVRNAYDPLLNKRRQNGPRNRFVLWRGTATHNRDVSTVVPDILSLAEKYPEFRWVFMGADPCAWQLSDKLGDRAIKAPSCDPIAYFVALATLKPQVVVTPLADTDFNRSKSNIAQIEAAYAGAPCVCPNWEEWLNIGHNNYDPSSNCSFQETMSFFMSNPKAAEHAAMTAWEEFSKNDVRYVNGKRFSLIQEMLG